MAKTSPDVDIQSLRVVGERRANQNAEPAKSDRDVEIPKDMRGPSLASAFRNELGQHRGKQVRIKYDIPGQEQQGQLTGIVGHTTPDGMVRFAKTDSSPNSPVTDRVFPAVDKNNELRLFPGNARNPQVDQFADVVMPPIDRKNLA